MKILRHLFFFTALVIVSSSLFAAPGDNLGPNENNFRADREFGPEDEDDVDPKILRQFIQDQGLIESRNKEGRLIIAGDARTRFSRTTEKLRGVRQRGFNEVAQVDTNIYKNEMNLYLDYLAPTSWAETRIKFAVFAGKDGGSLTRVDLDRAFLGYEIYEDGEDEFYIEGGRNRLDVLFDSKIEFSGIFDGILITFRKNIPKIGFFDIHGGPMLVNAYANHYAWIVETSLKNILESQFSFKYSFVDWQKRGTTRFFGLRNTKIEEILALTTPNGFQFQLRNNPRYRFIISQFLIGYEFKPHEATFCKTSWLYIGGLINHAARRITQTGFTRQNLGWYAGYTLGKMKVAGDWSIDLNYQFVEAQAVPDFDLAGIGRGNAAGFLFADAIIQGLAPHLSVGYANYKGFEITVLYALTDSLSFKARAQKTTPVNRGIGGSFSYSNIEFGAIFAF